MSFSGDPPRDLSQPRRVPPAFSIIELLIAASILAILVLLLLPTLTSARREARRVQCLTHMRQALTASQSYATESHDYPPMGWPTQFPGQTVAQVRGRIGSITAPYMQATGLWRFALHEQFGAGEPTYTCPGDESPGVWPRDEPVHAGGPFRSSSFNLTNAFRAPAEFFNDDASTQSTAPASVLRPQRLAAVTHPSAKAWLFEPVVLHRFGVAEPAELIPVPAATVGFVDGHADTRHPHDATPSVAYPGVHSGPVAYRDTRFGVQGRDH